MVEEVSGEQELVFLFTDIEGSTPLVQELGDDYLELIEQHHRILRRALSDHGGSEVRTEGDAFFATFDDPVAAIAACVQAQLALGEATWPRGVDLRVRMGLHRGSVRLASDHDFVGFPVYEAARVSSAAHGGQILVTDEMVAAHSERPLPEVDFVDLGLHALKGVNELRTLHQVRHPGLGLTFPPPNTQTARAHNLTMAPTELIGRAEEVGRVVDLLTGSARLVTLTGEGGIGKTRLAEECARQLLSWFRDGVWFVDLVPVRDPSAIPAVIAAAMGHDLGDGDLVEELAGAIGDDTALVVLDNFEHVVDGALGVADLLGRCPNLCVLATSRERLRLRGERRIGLDPLGLPDDDSVVAVAASPTVQLFVARAAEHDEAVVVDERTAPLLASLARRVDGLPLAVELAAARLLDFSLADIVERMDSAMDLLAEGDRDLPERQQALRSTIAWSEDLLEKQQRHVLRATGVFAGSFTAAAVAAVAEVSDEDAVAALAAVARAGLLRPVVEAEPLRWRALVPIRQYCLDALAGDGQLMGARSRFVDVMVELAERVGPEVVGPKQPWALDRFATDHDNLVEAFDHASDAQGAVLAEHSLRYFTLRGHLRQGRRVAQALWERPSLLPHQRVAVALMLGAVLMELSDHDGVEAICVAGIGQADGSEAAARLVPWLHVCRATAMLDLFRRDESQRTRAGEVLDLLASASELSDPNDPRLSVLVTHATARARWFAGDARGAVADFERLSRLWDSLGDQAAAAEAELNAVMLSDLEPHVRVRRLDDVVARARHSGAAASLLSALIAQADTALEADDHSYAAVAYEASDLAVGSADPWRRLEAARVAAEFAEVTGDLDRCITLLGRLREAAEELDLVDNVAEVDAELALLRASGGGDVSAP